MTLTLEELRRIQADALRDAALALYEGRRDLDGHKRFLTLEYEADLLGVGAWLTERAAQIETGEPLE